MLTNEQGKKLLRLAKDSINSYFEKKLEISEAIKKEFSSKQGAFVTLYKNNELKGCIGYAEPILPLYQAIIEGAQAAAFSDPRFVPVQKNDIKDIKIEISVLTKPVEIKFKDSSELLKQIEVGRDGLIIEKSGLKGLLLPQVAVEWKWDKQEFLSNTCMKARLPADAWKESNVKVYKFQSQIFNE